MKLFVTKHARRRIRQRIGIPSRAVRRWAVKILGEEPKEGISRHGGMIFIVKDGCLVTVMPDYHMRTDEEWKL